MRKLYVLFNRNKLTKDEIKSFQDFDEVLKRFHQSNIPIYKKPLFWSASGLASISLFLILSLTFKVNSTNNEEKIIVKNNDLPKDTECFTDKLKDIKENPQVFYFKSNTEQKVNLANGSVIEIDKNSFLLKENELIKLEVNEYNDSYSIFTSGINMDYKDKFAFESAGMIEISAYVNDKLVKINPRKPVKVSLKCNQNPEKFDFWKYNVDEKTWVSYPKSYSDKNILNEYRKLKFENKILEEELLKVNKNLNQLKEIKRENFKLSNNKQKFNLSYNENDFPELVHFKNILFEVAEENQYDKNFTKRKWTTMDLVKDNNNYIMKLNNGNENLNIKVRPVLTGKDEQIAENEFKVALNKVNVDKKNYQIKLNKIKAEIKNNETKIECIEKNNIIKKDVLHEEINNQKVKKNVSDIIFNTQNFEITTWGIFNSDNPIKYPNQFKNECAFICGSVLLRLKSIFVFDIKRNLRFQYGTINHPINSFGLFENKEYKIIAIDELGKIYSNSLLYQNKDEEIDKIKLNLFQGDESLNEWLKKFLSNDKNNTI